ncbi:CD225/dispanin family protein [Prescottella subtropica]|uniref:CD225/dispanin family protein n=1 Tax=Prescottella subtropica TaxID=2545757 RepID=UPI0010F6B9DF|nr:CD225/dispanin family protein [Prescottella subtropica]
MSEPNYTTGPSEPFGAPTGYPQQPYPPQPQYQPGPAPAQYGAAPTPPPSNAGWAVATLICFWPLAFVAFNHLHSIFPKWAAGDYMGAQYASERVKTLGKIAVGVFAGLVALYVIFVIIVIAVAANSADTSTTYYR